jgi:hypothetical protein
MPKLQNMRGIRMLTMFLKGFCRGCIGTPSGSITRHFRSRRLRSPDERGNMTVKGLSAITP